LSLFTACGLEVDQVYTDYLVQGVEQWLTNAHTPDNPAEKVRAMLEQDRVNDLSGTHPYLEDGMMYFRQRTATIVGRKLG